jgi:DNA repair protein RadC
MDNIMTISEWPIQERPREKLIHFGRAAVSNAELLAIIFGNGLRGQNVLELSRRLLQTYGGLHGIFNASFQSLTGQQGIGIAKYSQLQAAAELHCRYLQEQLKREGTLTHSQAVQQFLVAQLRGEEQEIFACLFLDNRYQVIRFEKLFRGTINMATVHPREVVKRALELNALAVIIAHNHPSGDPTPSTADRKLTERLSQALNLVEIQLVDHIIVSAAKTLSFAEHGYL